MREPVLGAERSWLDRVGEQIVERVDLVGIAAEQAARRACSLASELLGSASDDHGQGLVVPPQLDRLVEGRLVLATWEDRRELERGSRPAWTEVDRPLGGGVLLHVVRRSLLRAGERRLEAKRALLTKPRDRALESIGGCGEGRGVASRAFLVTAATGRDGEQSERGGHDC